MKHYSLADVSQLTGINTHTLRKWESRYDIVLAKRTDTNIRYYTDQQLRKLINVSILINDNFRISEIDKMSESELLQKSTEILQEKPQQSSIKGLIASMIFLDEQSFDAIVQRYNIHFGLLKTVTDLIYPFLKQVGILWLTNKAMPAQEHFISNLVRKHIFTEINALPKPKNDASSIVMLLPQDEYHEIGLLLSYYIAQKLGWKVYYLGADVPVENINEIMKITKPQLLMSFFFTNKSLPQLKSMINLCENYATDIIVAAPKNIVIGEHHKIIRVKNPEELIEILETKTNLIH